MSDFMSEIIPVNEADYLDQDPPLRGQSYVCLSFLSPEEVIKKKEAYMFERFLKFFSGEMNEFFTNLAIKYKDDEDIIRGIKERYTYLFNPEQITDEFNYFMTNSGSELEKEYLAKNNFQTTIRGIKVRGTFETLREAEIRCQVLKKLDSKFHVYVAEVGCWCPWSPNPDDIGNQEFAETQLNTLMKGYKDNQEKKDAFFQERKTTMQAYKPENKLSTPDPWIQRVQEDGVAVREAPPSEEDPLISTQTPHVSEEDPLISTQTPPTSEENPPLPLPELSNEDPTTVASTD